MKSFLWAAVFFMCNDSLQVSASFELIAGYEPSSSQVNDWCGIDLDQAKMEEQLDIQTDTSFNNARSFYESGAHSGVVAELTLESKTATYFPRGTIISGTSMEGGEVRGVLFKDYEAGSTVLQIAYKMEDSNVACQVGALAAVGESQTSGCFMEYGSLMIESEDYLSTRPFAFYEYDVVKDNRNWRQLARMSTSAEQFYFTCNDCPYETYSKFYDYYGQFDYANQWVQAAFDRQVTSFRNGNVDFSNSTKAIQSEAIRKGTVLLNIWMTVVGRMDGAVASCEQGDLDKSLIHWDTAVALYTGSLEGSDGSGDGVLLYAIADKSCENFDTCRSAESATSNASNVNYLLFQEFEHGQRLINSSLCSDLRSTKDRAQSLMTVPLVQGTLNSGFRRSWDTSDEKSDAEGATFAAAVLPLVHACSNEAAQTIYDNMHLGSITNTTAVKEAFEAQYECLGITCEDVGGLYNSTGQDYIENMSPCFSQPLASTVDIQTNAPKDGFILDGTTMSRAEDSTVAPSPQIPAALPSATPVTQESESPSAAPSMNGPVESTVVPTAELAVQGTEAPSMISTTRTTSVPTTPRSEQMAGPSNQNASSVRTSRLSLLSPAFVLAASLLCYLAK